MDWVSYLQAFSAPHSLSLFMPLKVAFGRGDNGAVLRIFLMITGAAFSLFSFIKSFINARKARENN